MRPDHPPLFKEYILNSSPYKGGSTRKDISTSGKVVLHKMSSNENPLGASPKAIEAIYKNLHQASEYGFQDDSIFTEKLSEFFEGRLMPEQFLPANSGMELLDIVCRAFLSPGDSCILSSPTFMAYKNFSEVCGAEVIDVPLQKDSFRLDVYGIIAAIRDNTKLIFISNPNNPTGSFISRTEMNELVNFLPDHVVLVCDEAYHQYVEQPDFPRAQDYIEKDRKVIGLHSFSKVYGLAGLRLGYIFSTPGIMNYIRRLRRPFMVNSLSMEAGMAAFDDWTHLAATLKINLAGKYWLYGQLDKLKMHYWKTEANFIMMRPAIDADLFARKLLEEGIMVRTTAVMGAPGCVRVTIGTREMNGAFITALTKIHPGHE
jgi:histidinol-phosphate aminotransferase